MEIGKKAVFFSVIALLLSSFAIASFVAYNTYKYSEQMDIIEVRVSSMDDFLTSIETDLSRALYISSFRSLISLNDHITNINKSKGVLLENVSASFAQIIRNGTIGNSALEEVLMEDQTINDWITKIEKIGLEIDINTTINLTFTSLAHTSPWSVGVTGNFTVILVDIRGLARWEKEIESTIEIEIIEFRDPLYANRTGGEFRQILPTEIDSWNVSYLRDFLDEGTYIAKSSSPTFLMRMEGRFIGDPNGILTLIDEDHIIAPENRSMVDFVYWGMKPNNTQKIHDITDNGYPAFRLDKEHIMYFNVSEKNYSGP